MLNMLHMVFMPTVCKPPHASAMGPAGGACAANADNSFAFFSAPHSIPEVYFSAMGENPPVEKGGRWLHLPMQLFRIPVLRRQTRERPESRSPKHMRAASFLQRTKCAAEMAALRPDIKGASLKEA